MVRLAVEYTDRTGIDGFKLTPAQLRFRMKVAEERDRLDRHNMARAILFAMNAATGGKPDWKDL